MTRYVMRAGQIVPKKSAPAKTGGFSMSDIKPFATQDGTPISSRSTLREYESRHGIKQIGTDFDYLKRKA